jgi:hypothetical protein
MFVIVQGLFHGDITSTIFLSWLVRNLNHICDEVCVITWHGEAHSKSYKIYEKSMRKSFLNTQNVVMVTCIYIPIASIRKQPIHNFRLEYAGLYYVHHLLIFFRNHTCSIPVWSIVDIIKEPIDFDGLSQESNWIPKVEMDSRN